MTDLVTKIVDGGLCHGCGACAATLGCDKIQMKMTDSGYLRPSPQTALTKDDQDEINRVCSGKSITQTLEAPSNDKIWGPLLSVETGHATDEHIRFQGSSGGTITAILLHLLKSKQIDFTIQTRRDPDDPLGNLTSPSYTRNEIISAAGSRYAPSSPLEHMEKFLQTGKRFAFVGKPCDIAALRMMAQNDPRINNQIPFMLSFFCAGVPSRSGALAVLQKLGVQEENIAEFSFRGQGWPGKTRVQLHDGTEATMDYHSSWGTILSRHLQFRCKICPEGIGEFSDITCADAWYGKDGYPDFSEQDGRSLILTRTAKGLALLQEMKRSGDLVTEELDVGEIRLMQPYQFDRRHAVLVRLAAMLLRGRKVPVFRGLHLFSCMLRSSPIWLARNFLGTFKRISFRKPLR